jgi:His-Xaa-Ser system protein HxsD
MTNKFLQQIADNQLMVEISLSIYNQEVVTASVYKFTDKCYIFQKSQKTGMVSVYFEPKENQSTELETIAKKFCNELIDQQVRFDTNLKYGSIRDAIVKKAFLPVTKINK